MFQTTFKSVKQFKMLGVLKAQKKGTASFLPSAPASTLENLPTPPGLTEPNVIDDIVNQCIKEHPYIVNNGLRNEW